MTVVAQHRIFLIRHGETVDNVAGLYAGIRDSALTVHGVQQALRLADYLALEGHRFTNVFSSDLSRAVRTAEALLKAQPNGSSGQRPPSLVKVTQLREQDFGFYEGKPFYTRSSSSKSGRESHYEDHKDEPGVQSPESKDSMMKRADEFLEQHLLPLLHASSSDLVVAIVSHGMLLSSLWKCILRRQPQHSVTINPEIIVNSRPITLEHLGGWINTGYLEIILRKEITLTSLNKPSDLTLSAEDIVRNPLNVTAKTDAVDTLLQPLATEAASASTSTPTTHRYTLEVRTINGKAHLQGLKRTGGGVGSSKFDDNQQSIKSFFKRPKTS